MQQYININLVLFNMRKLIASIILSFALLLPLTMVATPVLAQTDTVTSTTDDSSYYDSYDYGYDDSYYDFSYDLSDTDAEAGVLAGLGVMLFSGVMLVFSIVVGLGSYIYCSLALMKIAKRMDHENPWFAWIPILNMVLLLQLGDQNPVLLLLLLIPGVGAVVVGVLSIIALMKICEKRGYDKMLGLLSLIPVASYVLLGILAWGKKEPAVAVK
ncbi:MAG: hypothetical protein UR96_C0011G0002 [candidate division WS6 bacterium GW2011_GWC1_36_11]|uniref:Yip1 domain-containing protein n=3 Tax=Candidatus Dojkabacteria TaxID=74243 RepID=A0A0G0DU02_9BACT|nr:MAG: hypothetical protein UR96_C0011G0002 [candidate division WS6 bacterium GW2011_GWC1_36_11]KKQ04277.1 MAG: hypothetical protein US14_C0018G0003 [candidate division WS6 bacterium GW2011_WS6_36_26]KKQ11972.1 MAG: hypothetical protein US24_C0008G0004 [candidate division WS6 bacterium GW2011_GWC2_36_7]KKQ16588.1 MAG: hypothetical protein US29_C0021G0004 [candidate division WS6 bacterium GW2011_GWF1_36_8]